MAWKLSVQQPPCRLEFDSKAFNANKHTRFHTSNGDSDQIKAIIWPTLIETKTGMCLCKGIVVT